MTDPAHTAPADPPDPATARGVDLTDVGPATPAPSWCVPGTEPQWDRLTEKYGGGNMRTTMYNIAAVVAEELSKAVDRGVSGDVGSGLFIVVCGGWRWGDVDGAFEEFA